MFMNLGMLIANLTKYLLLAMRAQTLLFKG